MGCSVLVRLPGVRVVMAGFFLQGGSGGEGTGGSWEQEVSVGRDGGWMDRLREQEVPREGVRGQEGHLMGQEGSVEGVQPGEESSDRDATAG